MHGEREREEGGGEGGAGKHAACLVSAAEITRKRQRRGRDPDAFTVFSNADFALERKVGQDA